MRAREPLGRRIAAVIDERLVQASEARRGIRDDVLEPERLQHVDHEIGAGVLDGQGVSLGDERGRFRGERLGGLPRRERRGRGRGAGRLGGHWNGGSRESRCRGAAQELAAVNA